MDLDKATKENEILHKQDLSYKNEKFREQKEFERKLVEKTMKTNPYSTKLADRTKTKKERKELRASMKMGGLGPITEEDLQLPPSNYPEENLMDAGDDKIVDIEDKLNAEIA